MASRFSSAANGSGRRSNQEGRGEWSGRWVTEPRACSGLLPTSAAQASASSAPTLPSQRIMGILSARRGLEWLLGFYFLSHVPSTLLFDLQSVLPRDVYPIQLRNLLKWYTKEFKDPLLQYPPIWFKSFLFCELVFQLPFFPIATYAFFKGGCRWIRTPAIIYSVHTMTNLIPILATLLWEDFSKTSAFKGQGPKTFHERLALMCVYAPYFLIPLMLLLFMLRSPYYRYEEKRKKK